jgi:uncharacterized protein (TIGR02996 family)
MTPEQAERAVLEQPDLDQPRLAYADAVGGPRAELVRVQVAMAQLRRKCQRARNWSEQYDTQQRLLAKHGAEWAAPVAALVDAWTFRRGFPEQVTLDATRFLAEHETLYRRAPVLHLSLSGVRPVAAQLFASPALARIRSLDLRHNELGDAEVRALTESPHLGRLDWLDLAYNQIDRAGLDALAASQSLPRLGYLGFDGNRVADPTPRLGGVEDGMVHDMEYPALGKELQAKYGPKTWLSYSVHTDNWYPPDRDQFETY